MPVSTASKTMKLQLHRSVLMESGRLDLILASDNYPCLLNLSCSRLCQCALLTFSVILPPSVSGGGGDGCHQGSVNDDDNALPREEIEAAEARRRRANAYWLPLRRSK
jgi:hypothetical protein